MLDWKNLFRRRSISVPTLAYAINNGNVILYAGTLGAKAVYKYEEGKEENKWEPFNTGLDGVDQVYSLLAVPNGNGKISLYAGTNGWGVYKYDTENNTWKNINDLFHTTTLITSLFLVEDTGYKTIYLGTRNGDVLESTNDRDEWKLIGKCSLNPHLWLCGEAMPVFDSATTKDGKIIFMGIYGQGVYTHNIDSSCWNEFNESLYDYRVRNVHLVTQNDVANLYVGTYGGGIYKMAIN